MVERASVTGMRSVSAFSVAMQNASLLRLYRKVSIQTLFSFTPVSQTDSLFSTYLIGK
jgi:hypothetical protein